MYSETWMEKFCTQNGPKWLTICFCNVQSIKSLYRLSQFRYFRLTLHLTVHQIHQKFLLDQMNNFLEYCTCVLHVYHLAGQEWQHSKIIQHKYENKTETKHYKECNPIHCIKFVVPHTSADILPNYFLLYLRSWQYTKYSLEMRI
jgi:hypothetical protein